LLPQAARDNTMISAKNNASILLIGFPPMFS